MPPILGALSFTSRPPISIPMPPTASFARRAHGCRWIRGAITAPRCLRADRAGSAAGTVLSLIGTEGLDGRGEKDPAFSSSPRTHTTLDA